MYYLWQWKSDDGDILRRVLWQIKMRESDLFLLSSVGSLVCAARSAACSASA